MKVTALIPDQIIDEVKKLARGSNLTENLLIALKEWIALKHIKNLNKSIEKKPLEFQKKFCATKIRSINRTR